MSDGMPSESPDFEMVAAALRRDAADLEAYARVLGVTLADALPPGAVVVERKRGLSDRMAGREGKVERLEVMLGEQRLVLRLGRSRPEGEICKEVRGVVLSRTPVALDAWVDALTGAVLAWADSDAKAREAVERLLGGGGVG
ncbi:hypothetical protein BIV57_10270 [Mangrovactinospora gilvigrisea]|uniref:Uncharacterized protein n=1 Tax=Mangrovactinospora gilvigrisea TaxID=1428644 RepID=A0A1J7BFX2_9ACTN|nr:hypothetical protein [Mangrovactinospora gilvigrisea]OIV37579.1 hypothetical protein BIV57_10270 [Mangrovactinospora gilvigrisea]